MSISDELLEAIKKTNISNFLYTTHADVSDTIILRISDSKMLREEIERGEVFLD